MLVDLLTLAAMLICLITYSVYIRALVTLQPQSTYQVYDSLGGAQARLLLPKKQDSTASNGKLVLLLLWLWLLVLLLLLLPLPKKQDSTASDGKLVLLLLWLWL